MCFTINVNLIRDELENRYGVEFPDYDKFRPSYYYHAYSLPEIPALCSGYPDKLRLLKWGLIPSWVSNTDNANIIRYKTFNARSGTIRTKPSFAGSFKSQRCLIPVKGFFEWQHVGKEKIPWYVYSRDNDILSLAGLYSEWIENISGEKISTFTIITTEANELMSVIHNSKKRMPVILEREKENRWLDLSTDPSDAAGVLKPCPSEYLNSHTISNLINNKTANKNNPEIIREFMRAPDDTLFK